MYAKSNILQAIGNTPLVQLQKVLPPGCGRVLVKLEGANPTGSMKDRMAKAMIEGAEADGSLLAGNRVIEYTGGSTGTSVALVCAAKGYPLHIVTTDAASKEKRTHMQALGAELTIIPSVGGSVTKEMTETMIETARQLSEQPATHWTNQFYNVNQLTGYLVLADEIWHQTGGQVDAFVQSVGTGGSLRGTANRLRKYNPGLRVTAVEPSESAVLSGGEPGAHKIEGMGPGFVPPLWDPTLVDEILQVSTADAMDMARRLAREEALFAGTSSGANVLAAVRVAEMLGPDATVVTLLVDTGLKYLSTEQYGHL
jgi:cysteine synthase